jgi:hypothetical protein
MRAVSLERRSAMQRRAALRSTGPLARISDKGREVERLWRRCRLVIFKRDGFKCRRCGVAGVAHRRDSFDDRPVLHGAHILPKKTWAAMRFEPDNILTMCGWCHTEGPDAWHNRPAQAEAWANEHLGVEFMDRLRQLARSRVKLDMDDARNWLDALNERLKS